MKCANCDSGALFIYQITAEKEVLYCGKHLPKFLDARRRAGNLKTTEKFTEQRSEALALVETPEEPAPKPKKRKKAVENNEGNS